MILRGILPVALLAVLLMALKPAASSATQAQVAFTEKIEVNLVNLNVVVTTFWGRPVTDLTRDDFKVWEDGEPREVSHFARVIDGVAEESVSPPATPPDQISRGAASPATALDRSIILAFDSGIQRPYFRRAVKAARDFVAERSGEGIWWSVVVLATRPHLLLPLTNEAREVVETLDSMLLQNAAGWRFLAPTPAVARSPSLDGPWCRLVFTEQSLTFPYAARSLSELFRAYASVSGAKACVIYHQGRGGSSVTAVRDFLQVRRHIDLWRALGRQATSAGFKVYAMDVLGLNQHGGGAAKGNVSAATLHSVPSIAGADYGPTALAHKTGGAFFSLNRLDEALKAASRETATYYSLAFAAPHDHDGRSHDLEVKVRRRPWLRVRHSSGFYDVDPRTLLVEHLAAPAHFPKEGGALPLRLEIATRRTNEDELELTATVAMPVEKLALVPVDGKRAAEVDLFVALHDRRGALVSLKQDSRRVVPLVAAGEIEVALPQRISLPAGRYTITVALYDPASGLFGIASEQIGDRDA